MPTANTPIREGIIQAVVPFSAAWTSFCTYYSGSEASVLSEIGRLHDLEKIDSVDGNTKAKISRGGIIDINRIDEEAAVLFIHARDLEATGRSSNDTRHER